MPLRLVPAQRTQLLHLIEHHPDRGALAGRKILERVEDLPQRPLLLPDVRSSRLDLERRNEQPRRAVRTHAERGLHVPSDDLREILPSTAQPLRGALQHASRDVGQVGRRGEIHQERASAACAHPADRGEERGRLSDTTLAEQQELGARLAQRRRDSFDLGGAIGEVCSADGAVDAKWVRHGWERLSR